MTIRQRRPSRAVRVAPRATGPFDIDLGTNSSGATYAVYTRDDGDIYRLNVTTGSELKVGKLSSPTQVERDPTIMRGEIAFIRRSRGYDQLRIGNASSRSRGSRLILQRRSLAGAELGVGHIAYVVAVPGPISADGTKHVRIRDLAPAPSAGLQRDLGWPEPRRRHAPDVRARRRPASCGRARTRGWTRATASSATRCAARGSPTRRLAAAHLDGMGRQSAGRRGGVGVRGDGVRGRLRRRGRQLLHRAAQRAAGVQPRRRAAARSSSAVAASAGKNDSIDSSDDRDVDRGAERGDRADERQLAVAVAQAQRDGDLGRVGVDRGRAPPAG